MSPTFQLRPGSRPLSAPAPDSAQAGVALCSEPTAGGQRHSSGLPPGVEMDNVQRDLSAPGRSLFSPPFPHTEDIIHRLWTILIAPCVSCSLQMQLGLGVLVGALANSPNSSRMYPTRGSYTMHPCHSQKAPIRGSMAQEQAGAAHALFSVFAAQNCCCC